MEDPQQQFHILQRIIQHVFTIIQENPMRVGLIILAVALGVAYAAKPTGHFTTWRFDDPFSDEYGQFKGPKTTNCSCGTTYKSKGRIVGGKLTLENEYPHMAGVGSITSRGDFFQFCGSTILTPHHALTAAHCTFDLNPRDRLAILVGGHDLKSNNKHAKVYEVYQYLEHEGYNPRTFENDIAILVIKEKIAFSEVVGPACLPSRPMNDHLVGEYVKVTGWGDLSFNGAPSYLLRKVNLRVVPLNECADKYTAIKINRVTPTQFCTFRPSKDSCQGDSGGPVTWLNPDTNRFTLVGVVSFGKGCATDAPGINTDVAAHIDWVQNKIQRTSRYTDSGSCTTCA